MKNQLMRMVAAGLLSFIFLLPATGNGELVAVDEAEQSAAPQPDVTQVHPVDDTTPTPSPTDGFSEMPMEDGASDPIETPIPEESTPAPSETVTIEATPAGEEAIPTVAPAAPTLKGYVAVPAGTWVYVTRYADVSKHAFRLDADSVGYVFDTRDNSQGEPWVEIGFAMRQGTELVLKVGYLPAGQVSEVSAQQVDEWIAQAAVAADGFYLLGGKADRPLPLTVLHVAAPTPAPASTAAPEEPSASEAPSEPTDGLPETTVEPAEPTERPADHPSDPDHVVLPGEDNPDEQTDDAAIPEINDETDSQQEHINQQGDSATVPADTSDVSTQSNLESAEKRVWIEVERPEAGLYRGDEVTLRAMYEGFDAPPSFLWEYKSDMESEWVTYPTSDDQNSGTLVIKVNRDNVTWQWRVVAN